ncbi:MAG: J domain-containing protein [Chloroflexota bacterium]
MAPDADPYRTLGLSRGATLEEVRAAYRRLAKANHPDAAGEAALPRFLAIQAAYEQLIGGSGAGKARRAAAAPRRPWEAQPDRGDATGRAYGGRGRTTSPGGRGTSGSRGEGGPGPRPGAASGPGSGTGRASPGGSAESGESWARRKGGAGEPGAATDRPGRRRGYEPRTDSGDTDKPGNGPRSGARNKATLGSTSYDGADAGPFEPDWGGASWYGTTSGTYWTLNPKEYADPRKHGPEYQARARRTSRARAASGATGEEAAAEPTQDAAETADPTSTTWAGRPETDDGTDANGAPGEPARGARPTHTTSSWWDRTAGSSGGGRVDDEQAAGDRGARSGDRARPGGTSTAPGSLAEPPPPDLGRAAAEIARALTDDRPAGPRSRLARAFIGWLPIALGLSWLVGEMTGCGRFAATCDGGVVEPMLLVVQLAVLLGLLLLPAAASVATTAALALLVAAVVASLTLSATGGAADGDSRRAALGTVLLLAWLGGLAFAILRRLRTLSSPTSPVS